MTSAFAYLYLTTLRNALAQRLKRLRQPKYLAAAVAGAAYFYFFIFRWSFKSGGHAAGIPPEVIPMLVPVAGLALLLIVLGAWIFPRDRAALQFSEAEVAFLFPAPVSRRTLIHFKLLRAQLAILFSSLLLTALFRRGATAGSPAWIHAIGWWIALSTLNLHFMGASFTREILLDLGLNPLRRRLLFGGSAVAVAGICWMLVRHRLPALRDEDLASFSAMLAYAGQVLQEPPLAWLLAPFSAVVRPYFSPAPMEFLAALGPALLLLAAHYLWVARSDVAFEEASLALATRRAEIIAAAKEGRFSAGRKGPGKPRPQPFSLAGAGWAPLAFLWQNLIALGPLYRLRTWVIACGVATGLCSWLAADPARGPLLKVTGGFALMLGLWLLFFGPMFMRREIQQTLRQLDVIKAYPLRGWQVVLGQLLSPVVIMTLLQWLCLLVTTLAAVATTRDKGLALILGGGGALGIALLVPPLCALMLCLPYAAALCFPAWSQATAQVGGGIEAAGQRLIFFVGYVIVIAVAILPAAAVAAVAFIIVNWLAGQALAIAIAGVLASSVLAGELVAAVHWLGYRLEQFDLSQELPR